jgi:ParB-like chromosome segregation protein Spo0J
MKLFDELIKRRLDIHNSSKEPVFMDTSKIMFHETLSSLFIRQPNMIEKISKSMIEKGYDLSEPVVIVRIKGIGNYVGDGHTRTEAARKAGLIKIPIVYIDCETLEDAIQYTYNRQANRRNLTQKEILQAATLLSKKETRDGSGRSIDKLSKDLGVSASTITHARTVAKKATKEDIEAIKRGEKTINEAYQNVKESKPNKQNDSDKKETEKPAIPTIKTDKPVAIKQDEKNQQEKNKRKESISVKIEDIINLLSENKEINAGKLILNKYRNIISKEYFVILTNNLSKSEI